MKGYFLAFAVLALLAVAFGTSLPSEDEFEPQPLLIRMRRESCNLRACEQLCRRLGFTGGVCINGGTKCDCDRW